MGKSGGRSTAGRLVDNGFEIAHIARPKEAGIFAENSCPLSLDHSVLMLQGKCVFRTSFPAASTRSWTGDI